MWSSQPYCYIENEICLNANLNRHLWFCSSTQSRTAMYYLVGWVWWLIVHVTTKTKSRKIIKILGSCDLENTNFNPLSPPKCWQDVHDRNICSVGRYIKNHVSEVTWTHPAAWKPCARDCTDDAWASATELPRASCSIHLWFQGMLHLRD